MSVENEEGGSALCCQSKAVGVEDMEERSKWDTERWGLQEEANI